MTKEKRKNKKRVRRPDTRGAATDRTPSQEIKASKIKVKFQKHAEIRSCQRCLAMSDQTAEMIRKIV